MTALSADLNIKSRGPGGDTRYFKVEDNVKIYKGGIVVIDSSGYARPARNNLGDIVVGIADAQADNTIAGHTAGGINCKVISGRHFDMVTASAAQGWVGLDVYAVDDQTVGLLATGTNGNKVGKVSEYVSATEVWVFIPTPVAYKGVRPQATEGNLSEATQSTTATLTIAQLMGGLIESVPTGAITLTLPTAANAVAGFTRAQIGDSITCMIANDSAGANAITIAAGGATLRPGTPQTIAQNRSALIKITLTNVTGGSEAYNANIIVG